MINPMDLSGKHIVVTGASSGLGRATCVYLSELGATISLIARREDKLNETIAQMSGQCHKAFPYDVTDIEGIEKLVKRVVEENGKIDGYVHAAGIGTVKPASLTKYDFILEMMNIHLFSFVEFVRIITKKKNSNDGGSIVAVSSAGSRMSDKGKLAYASTKGSLDSAVRSLAIELGEMRKIRANTVNPGWIKTDMYYSYIEEFGQEKMDELLRMYALGAAEPGEVASVIGFLLSDASKKITGQNIFVDSGWSIHG